jgi:hypothetical protein
VIQGLRRDGHWKQFEKQNVEAVVPASVDLVTLWMDDFVDLRMMGLGTFALGVAFLHGG